MADCVDVAKEIDRLVHEGHQTSSLFPAVLKKYPGLTKSEFDEAFEEAIAARKRRVEAAEH